MNLTFCYIICFILAIVVIHCNISKHIHTLQQSFYHISEFFSALKISRGYRVKFLDVAIFLNSIAIILVNNIFKYVLFIAYILICLIKIKNYIKNKKMEKKKFDVTRRVKIIYFFSYVLIIAIVLVSYNFLKEKCLSILLLCNLLSILVVIIANICSLPIVNILNYRYIKEAKNILKEHKNLKIIGITGSYGKTSTKNIITEILSEKYSTVMTPKSYNTTLGVVKTIRENIKPYTEIFVCEMGASRVGDIAQICKIVKPDISVITSIGVQHLATFKKLENIIKEKFQIVKRSKKNSIAILNADYENINKNYLSYTDGREVIKYSFSNKENSCVENVCMSELGSTFDVVIDKEILNISTKLLGKHNIYNILCAVIIAKKLGMENDEIIRAVKKIKPIEHRLELKEMGGILVLDDSFNSNPEGSKMAIDCLNMFSNKYRVLVTPGMVELGSRENEFNKKFGKYATSCDFVILVGSNTTKYVKQGMDELNYKKYVIVNNINEAFYRLLEIKNEHENLIALIENDLPDCYLN